jgi:hypothetical protein
VFAALHITCDNRGRDHMDVEEVLKLLEQRNKEHRDRATSKSAATPEERIAAQIDSSIAEELDALIAEIRAKLSHRQ